MKNKKLLVTVIQLCSANDKTANLKNAALLIEKAHQKAKTKYIENYEHLICLPEVFNYRSEEAEQNNQNAENLKDGQTVLWAKELAAQHQIWLVAGSILEINPHCRKPFNTSFVINPSGELVCSYRKINLFTLQEENSPQLNEQKYRSAGENIVTFDSPFGRVGLAICFDLRFPALFSRMRDLGCDLVVMPSAFTYKTGQAHWETLCRARAIENQIFFVAPNQSIEAKCWGHSLVYDSWGELLGTLNEEVEAFLTVEIDKSKLTQVRNYLPMR
jgi:nitrilase